jgi:hypothetical protein
MNLEGGEGSRTRRNNSDDSFDSRFCGVVSEWRSSAKAAHRPQGAYPASSSRRSMPENGRPSATSSFAATMIREGNGVKIFKETVNVAAEVRGCLRQDQGKTTIYRLLKTSPYRCQSMNCALENYRTCALDRSSQPENLIIVIPAGFACCHFSTFTSHFVAIPVLFRKLKRDTAFSSSRHGRRIRTWMGPAFA